MSVNGAQGVAEDLFDEEARSYDALLVLSFGGPEEMAEVMPFLRNVAVGRNIPDERLAVVAHHYEGFGGVSPINGQNRALIAALEEQLQAQGPGLKIYFGNRICDPFVGDTVRQMRDDGVKAALVFVTSAFSSYSGCRQYREDLTRACLPLGAGAPTFDKLRVFYNHPGFIDPVIEKAREALDRYQTDVRADVALVFTAHSIPLSMAQHSSYEAQLEESCRLVAQGLGVTEYALVYQSRSGPPQSPWLEPDVCAHLRAIRAKGVDKVVLVPIGFISDHMEVLYDLDVEARQVANEIGVTLQRAETVGVHPAFLAMIRELILERMAAHPVRRFLGDYGPSHDICPVDCCLKGEEARPGVRHSKETLVGDR